MRYCIFCGMGIPPDAKYCQICGKEQPEYSAGVVDTDTADSPEDAPENGTFLGKLMAKPLKFALIGVVLLFGIIGALTFVAVLLLHK